MIFLPQISEIFADFLIASQFFFCPADFGDFCRFFNCFAIFLLLKQCNHRVLGAGNETMK